MAAPHWDGDFHTSYLNNADLIAAGIMRCVTTYGTEVYLGSSTSGQIWRYKETDRSWQKIGEVQNGLHEVHALSVATQGSDKYLFVGGDFTAVTNELSAQSANNAYNVVALNLTSGTISKLGTATVNGTDARVNTLKAVQWYDYSSPYLYPGIRCLVGGYFTNAGSVTSKGIALWQQGTAISPQWSGFSGGVTDHGDGNQPPQVYGIEATTTTGYNGRTEWDGIWLTGGFSRAIGGNTCLNIAKLTGQLGGSANWTYIGRAFQSVTNDNQTPCSSFVAGFYQDATSVCRAGTTIYFGGNGRGHQKADGTQLICVTCDGNVGSGYASFASVGTSSTSISDSCSVGPIQAMAAKGGDVYAAGTGVGAGTGFGKFSAGVWTSIDNPGDASSILGAASTSTNVYFVGESCWRYVP
jgi:hypothetical protein